MVASLTFNKNIPLKFVWSNYLKDKRYIAALKQDDPSRNKICASQMEVFYSRHVHLKSDPIACDHEPESHR